MKLKFETFFNFLFPLTAFCTDWKQEYGEKSDKMSESWSKFPSCNKNLKKILKKFHNVPPKIVFEIPPFPTI